MVPSASDGPVPTAGRDSHEHFQKFDGRARNAAPSLFRQNRARGGCDHLRPSIRHDLLLGAPLLAVLILACALCIGTAGWPDSDGTVGDEFDDGILKYKIVKEDPNEVSVIGLVNSETSSITITNTVKDKEGNEYTVISIGDLAFYKCESLTSIQIPETVTSIGGWAFFCSSGLTSVTIPSGVTQIGECTFYHCSGLSSVTFQGQVTSIGKDAFNGCYSLTSIQIPDTVTTIKDFAFNNCSALTEIQIPDSVNSIGSRAFDYCPGLQSIRFGTGINTIGWAAFARQQFYDETGTIEYDQYWQVDELRGRLFKADGNGSSKMIRQPLYTLTFDCGDGSPKEVKYNEGGRIAKPDDPEKTGYSFMYWAKDGEKFDFDTETMPAKDMTLTAVWKADTFTVRFVTGTGTEIAEVHEYDEAITLPREGGEISKTGYSLSGWQISGQGDVFGPGTEYTVTSEVTFTAVWTVNQYTISFDSDGGSHVEPIRQDYGTLVEKPADPTKEGYSFLYWTKDSKEYTFGTMPAEDIVLKAVWKAHVFTVTFVTGTGTEIAEVHEYDEAITLPGEGGEISKAGYTLSGWQISEEGDVFGPGTEYTVTSEVTFTAVWTVNQYTISFDSDGGSAVDSITQDYGTLVEKPADPEKEGHSFLYWAKDGKEYTFGTMPAEDIVLKAVWDAHVFTVTFVTGTGTEIAYEHAYGSSITLPGEGGEISKTGYTLSGWQISGEGNAYKPGTEFIVTSEVTFTAVWKAVPAWDDDDVPFVPVPDSDTGGKSSDAGSGTSVASVAIAAGCAAALLVMLAMIGNGRSRS